MKPYAINLGNISIFYNRPDGNLYYSTDCHNFELVDGFSLDECTQALDNGAMFIFIVGQPVSNVYLK